MTVQIIEDSQELSERLWQALESLQNVEVLGSADNAAGGIAAIRERQPNVVILDLGLKGSSGIDVLRSLDRDKERPVVLVFSESVDPIIRKACLAAGADEVFAKATDYPRLLAKVADLSAATA